MDRSQIFTRNDIFNLIAAGDIIVIKDNNVLRLNGWLDKHPGGRLAVLHMVGRDATDEINISHSPVTMKMMNAYRIGQIIGQWENFTPPIQGGIFNNESEDSADSSSDDSEHSVSSTFEDAGDDVSSNTSVELDDTPDTIPEKRLHSTRSTLKPHQLPSKEAYVSQAVQDDINANIRAYPSLDAATQRAITKKYQALHDLVKREGFYDCDYAAYGYELMRYSALFVLFVSFLHYGWYATSAVCLGLFWHQIMFTAHDAGHRGITHNFVIDTLIGIFIGDFCCGLSIGWWKSSHNVHHLVTNQPEHDPDIQNIPLFATSSAFLRTMHSSYYDFTFIYDAAAAITLPYQAYTYYPVMALARFNLYFLSWAHLLSPRSTNMGKAAWTRPVEILSIASYFAWYGYLIVWLSIPTWKARILFVLVSHLVTMPLHVQITLSHWGMPTCILPGECFAQHQLRTTMDVDCPAWLDFIHGGLQFQAVHHLFPRMPRHNLRKLQPHVRQFCAETGIKYSIYSFGDGNRKVVGKLSEVAQQAMMMAKCQLHMQVTGETGLH